MEAKHVSELKVGDKVAGRLKRGGQRGRALAVVAAPVLEQSGYVVAFEQNIRGWFYLNETVHVTESA